MLENEPEFELQFSFSLQPIIQKIYRKLGLKMKKLE